jgi:NTP pyrophosphatase (non-canonical NTP hydrolase)
MPVIVAPEGIDVEVREVQRQAWQNKLAKGFNTTDVALEFGLLTAEVGEAFTAWRRQEADFGAELADVLIYLASLAQMTGVDLSAEVERKLARNARREYRRDERGVLRRVSDPAGPAAPN